MYQKQDPITAASIEWSEEEVPFSPTFGDIYYSPEDGVAETEYVFLAGNRLKERFQEGNNMTIAETGFGTGLNFFCTRKYWQEYAPDEARLHYISFEKYPVAKEDLLRLAQQYADFSEDITALCRQYPERVPGFHRLEFDEGKVILDLIFGDLNEMLPQVNANVDAWFLDGFAPKKNPDMWSETLYAQMARLTKPGGTFSTFTVAGVVRRGVENVGFAYERKKGFANKREMLCGVYTDPRPQPLSKAPWFVLPKLERPKDVAVIGGGLAGTSAAYSLAKRGWQVRLIERHESLAKEASGNRAGVIMPVLTAAHDPLGKCYRSCFLHAIRQLPEEHEAAGVLQLFSEKQPQAKVEKILADGFFSDEVARLVSASEASEIAGVTLSQSGVFFKGATSIDPTLLCQSYMDAYPEQITTVFAKEALSLRFQDNQWFVFDEKDKEIASAANVVIANGYDAKHFEQTKSLPLTKIRGQVTYVPETDVSKSLKKTLVYDGYITPSSGGGHTLGATFGLKDEGAEMREEEHRDNLASLTNVTPDLAESFSLDDVEGKVGFRVAATDHWPVVGPVPVAEFYQEQYHDLHHGRAKNYSAAEYHPGLYISVAHGSRGLTSTPLLSELLVSEMNQEPLPIENGLLPYLHPGRFLVRELKRRS